MLCGSHDSFREIIPGNDHARFRLRFSCQRMKRIVPFARQVFLMFHPLDYESFRHPEDIEVAILILSESFFKERFPPSNLALCSIQHSLNGTNELAIPMLPDKITIAKIFGITNGMIL